MTPGFRAVTRALRKGLDEVGDLDKYPWSPRVTWMHCLVGEIPGSHSARLATGLVPSPH